MDQERLHFHWSSPGLSCSHPQGPGRRAKWGKEEERERELGEPQDTALSGPQWRPQSWGNRTVYPLEMMGNLRPQLFSSTPLLHKSKKKEVEVRKQLQQH